MRAARTGTLGETAATEVTDASPGGERSTSGRRSGHAASRLPVSVVALSAATGVLLVAAAYTAGRLGPSGSPWADRAYWLGQALILVPTTVRLVGRRILTSAETVALVVVLTVAEYLVLVCYSPAEFTYPDELEHWRSTVNLLQTGKPFTVNYLLPISPHYPGLEEVTSALVSVTGLGVFTSGLIVAGVAHLLFVWLLYVLFREVGGSYRVAGVAVLVYASNSLFESFDSMFVYQTLALPFLGLTLLATWRLARPGIEGRGGWLALTVVAILATVITHHVTSYVLVVTLVGITLAALLTGHRQAAGWTAIPAFLSALAVTGWIILAAPGTWSYLQPFTAGILQGLQAIFTGEHVAAAPALTGPLGNKILAAAAVLVISALLPVGWWRVWRRHRNQPLPVTMAIGSVSWYAVVILRFTVADGSELAGRSDTFVFVPVAYVAALAVGYLAGAVVRRQARVVAAAVLVVVLLLLFDGLVNGWPPYWERLPGAYQVAGSERSVEPETVAGARWALAALGPGNRFATDVGSYAVLGGYGDQNPVRDVAYLYETRTWTALDLSRSAQQALHYVWVDERLSRSLPASGQYFPVDPNAGKYKRPLSPADLAKFDNVPDLDRIYDSGNVVIYQLPRS
jgi:hypothetical protein